MKNDGKTDFYKDYPGLGEPHSEKDAPKGWGTLNTNGEKYGFFTADTMKPARSRLIINRNLIFETRKGVPNIWHRFWLRFLLGWKWERVD